jgi:hypothetical protein
LKQKLNYNCKINTTVFAISGLYSSLDLSVDKPFDYLGYLSADSVSSIKFNAYIQGINDVVNNVKPFFTFGNQSGIFIDVDAIGCHVHDELDEVFIEQEMYCVDHADMLPILTDFRDFLILHGK